MNAKPVLLFLAVIASLPPNPVQEAPLTIANNVQQAQEFLRLLYPDLNNKGYMMSVETSQAYDAPADAMSGFKVYIGERAVGAITGVVGGYRGPTPPKDYRPGPSYATQFLTSDFTFHTSGRIVSFSVSGPAVGKPDAFERVLGEVTHHASLTDDEVVTILRREGVKYGPWNKDEFVRSLPLQKLATFLGKLASISAEFISRDEDHFVPSDFGIWKVTATATWKNGDTAKYEFDFELFKGDLTAISTIP